MLLELFTSEGCSSCPPADEVLAELDDASGQTIALAFHVDYWNELGWVDPFSRPAFTDRQQAYARAFGARGMYTPQLVVNGVREFVGSSRGEAKAAIGVASVVPTSTHLRLAIDGTSPGKWLVAYDVTGAPAGATLYLATTRRRATTEVPRGENKGRTLHHVHVVSDVITLVPGRGTTALARPEGDAEVVGWVQQTTRAEGGGLPVLASARVEGR